MVQTLSALLAKSSLTEADHEQILSRANDDLKTNKSDITAQKLKVVAHLQLEQYDAAAKFVRESGKALESSARLESAYALYKAGQLKAAEKVANEAGESRGLQHVRAQIVSLVQER
jgi:signal recognition particle subunit SRP72